MSEPKPIVEVTERFQLNRDYKDAEGQFSIPELMSMLASLPSRGLTPVYLEIEDGYEDARDLVLVCRRPETDYERELRELQAARHKKQLEDSDRAQYEHLRKKFEGK
jgi:hypothetical protein